MGQMICIHFVERSSIGNIDFKLSSKNLIERAADVGLDVFACGTDQVSPLHLNAPRGYAGVSFVVVLCDVAHFSVVYWGGIPYLAIWDTTVA